MASESIAEKVKKIAIPIADGLGVELWDVVYVKEGVSWFLRIFVDKDSGISIEDCENFSRAIDPPLDKADFIKDSYYLEVSSPGLFRELTKPEHFEKMNGRRILVKLIRPQDGEREFTGELQSLDGPLVTILMDNQQYSFNKSEIAKVTLNDFEKNKK